MRRRLRFCRSRGSFDICSGDCYSDAINDIATASNARRPVLIGKSRSLSSEKRLGAGTRERGKLLLEHKNPVLPEAVRALSRRGHAGAAERSSRCICGADAADALISKEVTHGHEKKAKAEIFAR